MPKKLLKGYVIVKKPTLKPELYSFTEKYGVRKYSDTPIETEYIEVIGYEPNFPLPPKD